MAKKHNHFSPLLRETLKRFSGHFVPERLILWFPGGLDSDSDPYHIEAPLSALRTQDDIFKLIAVLTEESFIKSHAGIPLLTDRDGPDHCAPQLFW